MTKAEWQAKREDFLKRYEAWKVWKKQKVAELTASLIEEYKADHNGEEPKYVNVW